MVFIGLVSIYVVHEIKHVGVASLRSRPPFLSMGFIGI
jgi:hypothetical protein